MCRRDSHLPFRNTSTMVPGMLLLGAEQHDVRVLQLSKGILDDLAGFECLGNDCKSLTCLVQLEVAANRGYKHVLRRELQACLGPDADVLPINYDGPGKGAQPIRRQGLKVRDLSETAQKAYSRALEEAQRRSGDVAGTALTEAA